MRSQKKLAIITTHPIQYNAPLFKLLAERKKISIKVFYTWGASALADKYDPGFGKTFKWDIPLLEGYEYTFTKNVAANPGSHHFKGIVNPLLIEDIKDWGADAVLIYGWSFRSHLSCMRYFHKKIPVIFRGDSILETDNGKLRGIIRKIFLKWVYSHADKALYTGTRNKQYYTYFGLKESQLIFAPHAIDNNRFNLACSKERVGERISLNIPPDAVVFLFAGKLEPKKDPKILLNAFKKVNKHAYLIVAGNGVMEAELKKEFENVPNVIFLPFQNQSKMPALYKMADVYVLPSRGPNETWGLAVNEAMACERAVLVSDACGCAPDLVKDGINGFIFKTKDLNDLIRIMNFLLVDTKKLVTMGKASAAIISTWSFENDCIAIEEVLSNEQ